MKKFNTKVAAVMTLGIMMALMVLVPLVRAEVTITPGGVIYEDNQALTNTVTSDASSFDPNNPRVMAHYRTDYYAVIHDTRIEACAKAETDVKDARFSDKFGQGQPNSDYKHCYASGTYSPVHVVSTNPAANGITHDPTQTITATFSGDVRSQSVTNYTFVLKMGKKGAEIPAIVGYDAVTKTATLNPAAPLQDGLYTAIIHVKDSKGVLIEPYTWSFTVEKCTSGVTLPDGSCIP